MQAHVANMLQMNKRLQRVQAAARRDLLFVNDEIAKHQADCKRLMAQNQYLQQRISTLTAVGTTLCTTSTPSI